MALASLGIGLLLVCYLTLSGRRMEVQLTMLGYTNVPFAALGYTNISSSGAADGVKGEPLGMFVAVLLATNTGSVPVELRKGMRPEDVFDPSFAKHTPRGLPAVIKPGESVTLRVTPPFDSRWRTTFFYQRHALLDRLYGKAWARGNRTVQTVMARWLPLRKDGMAQIGWITNTLRNVVLYRDDRGVPHILYDVDLTNARACRFHISAPPPPVSADLIERLRSPE